MWLIWRLIWRYCLQITTTVFPLAHCLYWHWTWFPPIILFFEKWGWLAVMWFFAIILLMALFCTWKGRSDINWIMFFVIIWKSLLVYGPYVFTIYCVNTMEYFSIGMW